jgi:hypothetical protein
MVLLLIRHLPKSLDQNMQVFHRVVLQLEYIVQFAQIFQLFNNTQSD